MTYEPLVETRNRKPLEQPASIGADWELRCGADNRFRVFWPRELRAAEGEQGVQTSSAPQSAPRLEATLAGAARARRWCRRTWFVGPTSTSWKLALRGLLIAFAEPKSIGSRQSADYGQGIWISASAGVMFHSPI